MTTQELEQAILESFITINKVKYIGRIKVIEHKDHDGYTLVLGLNNNEKELTMSCDGTAEQFLSFIRKEIRERQLCRVDYYSGYQVKPDNKC